MSAIVETCACGASIVLPTGTAAERIGNAGRLADWRANHRCVHPCSGRLGVPLRDSTCNCPETGQDEPPTRTVQKVTGL